MRNLRIFKVTSSAPNELELYFFLVAQFFVRLFDYQLFAKKKKRQQQQHDRVM